MNKLKISFGFVFIFLCLIGVAFNAVADVQRDEEQVKVKLESAELNGWELTLSYEDQEKLLSAKASGAPYIMMYDNVSFFLGLPKFVPGIRDYNDLSHVDSGAGYVLADNVYCLDLYNDAQVQVFEHENFGGNSMGVIQPGMNFLGSFGEKATSIKWITNEIPWGNVIDDVQRDEEQEKLLSAKASGAPYIMVWDYYSWIFGYPPPLIVPGPRDYNDLLHYWTPFGRLGDNIEYIGLYNGAKVIVYEHDNFMGNFMRLEQPGINFLGSFGQQASSIRWITTDEPPGPYVILYEDNYYQGRSIRINFPIDMNCLKSTPFGNMNNTISSFKLFNGGAICVFKDAHFGAGKIFTENVAALSSSYPAYQDNISSITWDHASMGY